MTTDEKIIVAFINASIEFQEKYPSKINYDEFIDTSDLHKKYSKAFELIKDRALTIQKVNNEQVIINGTELIKIIERKVNKRLV